MKLLKSITIVVCLLSVSIVDAQWKKIKGNGELKTITRNTSEYDGIKVSGSMDVILVEGNEGDLTIEAESNLLEYIITKVKDDVLYIKLKKNINLRSSKGMTVTVPYKTISSVSISGSGDVENKGTIKSDSFDVAIAGSGDISLNLNSGTVSNKISGSGQITLNGSSQNLSVAIAGSGDFEGKNLKSKNVDVKISGSGNADVVCNGGELNVKIVGSGDVSYSGNPKTKNTKVLGSGSVRG